MSLEIKFRAIIKDRNSTIFFNLSDLVKTTPFFSDRELLYPWLRAGNLPDQFTGLRDKNNKEIYEGDILANNWWQYEVFWNPKQACFQMKGIERKEVVPIGSARAKIHGNAYMDDMRDIEVIGNIHENPELLEEKP